MESIIFDNWLSLVRVLLVGVLAYAALVVTLRISGKRTLSIMNVFDLVVTVALAEGTLAFALLIALQFIVAWSPVRSSDVSDLVKASPRLLFYSGDFLRAAMCSERVTETEVLAAVRGAGHADLAAVGAVVLETDSSFSVLPKLENPRRSALNTVSGRPKGRAARVVR